jgi:hypothetical protein
VLTNFSTKTSSVSFWLFPLWSNCIRGLGDIVGYRNVQIVLKYMQCLLCALAYLIGVLMHLLQLLNMKLLHLMMFSAWMVLFQVICVALCKTML